MNYENIAQLLEAYAGGDNKLWINLAWPNMLAPSNIFQTFQWDQQSDEFCWVTQSKTR